MNFLTNKNTGQTDILQYHPIEVYFLNDILHVADKNCDLLIKNMKKGRSSFFIFAYIKML
jgi:hypothetical protein